MDNPIFEKDTSGKPFVPRIKEAMFEPEYKPFGVKRKVYPKGIGRWLFVLSFIMIAAVIALLFTGYIILASLLSLVASCVGFAARIGNPKEKLMDCFLIGSVLLIFLLL